jgi:dephospho-CoA kinase
MTRAQFNRWCDLGQPPLTTPEPKPAPRPQADDVTRIVRQEINAAIALLVDTLGQECGLAERALREQLQAEVGQLRASLTVSQSQAANEIAKLRQEVENLQRQVALDVPLLPLHAGTRQHEH